MTLKISIKAKGNKSSLISTKMCKLRNVQLQEIVNMIVYTQLTPIYKYYQKVDIIYEETKNL